MSYNKTQAVNGIMQDRLQSIQHTKMTSEPRLASVGLIGCDKIL